MKDTFRLQYVFCSMQCMAISLHTYVCKEKYVFCKKIRLQKNTFFAVCNGWQFHYTRSFPAVRQLQPRGAGSEVARLVHGLNSIEAPSPYGVATVSRIDKITSLFCRI